MSTTNSQHYSKNGEVALFVSLLIVTSLQAASLVLTLAMAGEIPREIEIIQSVIDLINIIIWSGIKLQLVIWWQMKKKNTYEKVPKILVTSPDLMEAQVRDRSDQRGRFYLKILLLSGLSLLLMCCNKVVCLVYRLS